MSVSIPGVCGWIGPTSGTEPATSLDDIVAGIPWHGDYNSLTMDTAAVAACAGQLWRTPEGRLCAIAGSPEWQDIDLADTSLKEGPARALAHAYRKYGPDLLQQLLGRFSIIVHDPATAFSLVAVDRFSQMPIFWRRQGECLAFGPSVDALVRFAKQRPSLSSQGLYNYLFFHMVPSPSSIYEGISRLPAGHVLTVKGASIQVSRYWNAEFREHEGAASEEEMLQLIENSVSRLSQSGSVGAFLSGGLDSSTVAGMLARKHPGRAPTYSIGFDVTGYDEIAYARMANERFQTQGHEYYVTPEDVLEALPTVAAAYDEPFGNSSALPAYFCAKLAASDGIDTLLGGDGGDELFAGNERYAKQYVFELYGGLPDGLRTSILEPSLGMLPKNNFYLNKARSYIKQARVPLPDRLQNYNFIVRLGHENIITPEFGASIDSNIPIDLERSIYDTPENCSRLNRMLYLDWAHTLADNDLRKVTRMCQLAGIEVEYPLLDDRVVEFSTRVSSFQKMRFNKLRHFYKKAIRDFLPAEIINKEKHGFGLPFGIWMAEHPGLQELAGDNLQRMRRRRIIRTDFIDRLLDLHQQQHAGYYGEYLWVLVMLELWLTAHGHEP